VRANASTVAGATVEARVGKDGRTRKVAKGYDPFLAHIHEGVGPSAAFVGDWLATEILDRILRQKRESTLAFRDRGRIRCFLNDNLAAHVTVV
jgi:hypothetical protein